MLANSSDLHALVQNMAHWAASNDSIRETNILSVRPGPADPPTLLKSICACMCANSITCFTQKFVGRPALLVSAVDVLLLGSGLQEHSLCDVLFEFAVFGARFSSEWPTIFPEKHCDLLHELQMLLSRRSSIAVILQLLFAQGSLSVLISQPVLVEFCWGISGQVRGVLEYRSHVCDL